MSGNERQILKTPFGDFEIGPMQVSDLYWYKLMNCLQEEFNIHAGERDNPFSFEERAQIIVRTWDKLRK